MIKTSSLPRNHMLSSPRPASSSSRSTRVLEELQENLENIQKELENTKQQVNNNYIFMTFPSHIYQLQVARDTKEQYEKENQSFIESNKQLRAEIHEVMQVLESKQQLLDDTKKQYLSNENKVKQLKDEAMAARKELDDLKRRELMIEKERRTVEILKEKLSQQSKLLDQSVTRHQTEFDKEIQAQKELLESIQQETQRLKSLNIADIVKEKVEKQASERKRLIEDLKRVEEEMEVNTQSFIEQIKGDLTALLNHVDTQPDLSEQVNQCKDAVSSLSVKIK
jgi:DNA repair exonuclease SbcCD ATPase subunit